MWACGSRVRRRRATAGRGFSSPAKHAREQVCGGARGGAPGAQLRREGRRATLGSLPKALNLVGQPNELGNRCREGDLEGGGDEVPAALGTERGGNAPQCASLVCPSRGSAAFRYERGKVRRLLAAARARGAGSLDEGVPVCACDVNRGARRGSAALLVLPARRHVCVCGRPAQVERSLWQGGGRVHIGWACPANPSSRRH